MDMNCRNAADTAAATDDTADAPHPFPQPDQGMATGHMPATAAAALPAVSIAVFAYNEENLIEACLDSIAGCAGEADISVHVLVNGCTDRTVEIVRRHAAARADVHPVIIPLGDKANAWNHYTHSVAPENAAIHCFIDGDMTIAKGSVSALLRAFADDPSAHGCAALPMGRRREAYRRKLVGKREMSGNFYALRGSFLDGFRHRDIRLPVGMFGEDGLVTSLAKFGLDMGPIEEWRVTSCAGAQYDYVSLSPFRMADWRIFRNRLMRYAVRHQQNRMLYPLLWEKGAAAMPAHVIDLYRARQRMLRLEWRGMQTLFDWIAIRRIRRDAALGEQAKSEDRAHAYS